MAEIERRKPHEVAQQRGFLSEALENFPVEELDHAEMEVFTSAKAHVEELEDIAGRKGIELGGSEEKEGSAPKVEVAIGFQSFAQIGNIIYPEGSNIAVRIDGQEVSKILVKRHGMFYDKRLNRAIKKAKKFAQNFGEEVIVKSTKIAKPK